MCGFAYLPSANVLYSFRKRSPGDSAQFEGVGAHFEHIVDDGTKSGRRIHGGKQNHIAKLDKHLEVVVIRALYGNAPRVSIVRKRVRRKIIL